MSTLLLKELKEIFEGWDPNTEIPEKFWYFWHARFQNGDRDLPGVLEIFASESISDPRYPMERRAIFIPMARSTYVAILYRGEIIKYVSLCRFLKVEKGGVVSELRCLVCTAVGSSFRKCGTRASVSYLAYMDVD